MLLLLINTLNDTINELSISDYDLICDDGDEDQFTDDVDDLVKIDLFGQL